ncbi:SEA (Seh1-associated) complex subunit [Coemansia sp. RSA 2599]|nr:SEA (Seh1-associated) complex subunit [Coemansia sp. RSA 2598]KAJ1825433.1 SEA (Seh1-associated) complex subunit [Coemansia sp. RSA 2599]
MFPSKSVVSDIASIGAVDQSSDEEQYFKHNSIKSPLTVSHHSSSSSLTHLRAGGQRSSLHQQQQQQQQNQMHLQLQQQLQMVSTAAGSRLDRGFMSLSHTNLQQVALNAKKNRAPSPMGQSTTNSLPGLANNYVSEPTTPATRQGTQQGGSGHLGNQSMASMTSASIMHKLPRHVSSPSSKKQLLADETPGSGTTNDADATQYPGFLSAPSSFIHTVQHTAGNGSAECGSAIDGFGDGNRDTTADGKEAPTLLILKDQRNVTKAELKLVVESCAYYANKGDVQTAVTVALLMRNFIKLSKWTVAEHWFACYVDFLDRHKAFHLATEIILASPFMSISEAVKSRAYMYLSCNHCGSLMTSIPGIGPPEAGTFGARGAGTAAMLSI